MILSLYSIYDRLVGVYLTPFPARGDAEAMRQVLNTLQDPAAAMLPLVKKPADYDLCHVGVMDDETGVITQAGGKPRMLWNLRVLVASEEVPSDVAAVAADDRKSV